MTYKNFLFIFASVFILSFASCVSESCLFPPDPNPITEYGEERAVSLRIVQHADNGTRSVGRPICDGEPVAFNTGYIYMVNSTTGIIHRTIRVVAGDAVLNTSGTVHTVGRDLLDDGVLMPSVPGMVNRVYVFGNPQVLLPTSGTINQVRQALIDDNNNRYIASQYNVLSPGINMWGHNTAPFTPAAVQPAPPALRVYETTVHIAPTVARFELASIVGMGDIRRFSVCGIFMDNYHRQAHRDGTRPAGVAGNRIQVAANGFQPNTGDFVTRGISTTHPNPISGGPNTTVTGGALFTSYSNPLIAILENNLPTARPFGVAPPWECTSIVCNKATNPNGEHVNVRNTWGYQVFTRDISMNTQTYSGTQPPRMIIRLRDVYIVDRSQGAAPDAVIPMPGCNGVFYLTVHDFRRTDNNQMLSAVGIRASNVYRIQQLDFSQTDLTCEPNTNPINVDVDVTLAVWNGEELRPEGFRQPNPIGGMADAVGAFAFPLGAASNGRCADAIQYRWEQSVQGVAVPNPGNPAHWEPVPGAAGLWCATLHANREFSVTGLTADRWFRRVATSCGDTHITLPARVVVPYLIVTPGAWFFGQPSGSFHTFTVSTNLTGDIEVTGLPYWINPTVTYNQSARTFTLTTNASHTGYPRPTHPITVTVGGVSQTVTISQHGTAVDQTGLLADAFVGAFWRHNQFGERLIRMTQPTDNAWTAVATEPWIQLCNDPDVFNFAAFTNETGAMIVRADTPLLPTVTANQGVSVSGTGTQINFRIGIRACDLVPGHNAPASAIAAPRYGQVIVTHNNNQTVHIIWVRQGEAADYVMHRTVGSNNPDGVARAAARRFSPFNLTVPPLANGRPNNALLGTSLDFRGGGFVWYPTQAGAYFTWAGYTFPRLASTPQGGLAGPSASGNWGPIANLGATHETCPPGFRRPNDGHVGNTATTVAVGAQDATAILQSEMRQSLFLNPPTGGWGAGNSENSAFGFYADGFFDRRAITIFAENFTPSTEANVVATGTHYIAFRGSLFFNPRSNASVFLPAGGGPNFDAGPNDVGDAGLFWSTTQGNTVSSSWILVATSTPGMGTLTRMILANVRCVAE